MNRTVVLTPEPDQTCQIIIVNKKLFTNFFYATNKTVKSYTTSYFELFPKDVLDRLEE